MDEGIECKVLMGGLMSQEERDETMEKFRKGLIKVLITTNLLARGIDVRSVSLVINFDVPTMKPPGTEEMIADPENYLHRIGRTGRWATKGVALTVIDKNRPEDMRFMNEIEAYYGMKIEEIGSKTEDLEKLEEMVKKCEDDNDNVVEEMKKLKL